MDGTRPETLPGMPWGMPLVMVLLGIACGAVGPTMVAADHAPHAVQGLGTGLAMVGQSLIEFGAILQVALWVCVAFLRRGGGTA